MFNPVDLDITSIAVNIKALDVADPAAVIRPSHVLRHVGSTHTQRLREQRFERELEEDMNAEDSEDTEDAEEGIR